MTKITKLTQEQEEYLKVFRNEYLQMGISNYQASDEEIIKTVQILYQSKGLKTPEVIVTDTPVQALKIRYEILKKAEPQKKHELYQPLWFGGGSEFYWISFYKFCQHIGVTFSEELQAQLDAWFEYAKVCGPMYAYPTHAFVSRKHKFVSFDEQGRLHNDTQAAMEFHDGFSIYCYHGIRVPKEWILTPDQVRPEDVLRVENVEQRIAGCKLIGWPRMATKLAMKIIDGDPNTDIGALVELTLPGLQEPGRFLMAVCPRNGTICEGVPRTSDIDNRPINTVIGAQAWRDGLKTDEYSHAPLRT